MVLGGMGVAELEEYGIDLDTLRAMLDEWRAGANKSALERRYLNRPESHGKLFTTLVRRHLGVETERRSSQTGRIRDLEAEVARLRDLLLIAGIDPERPAT
ncbi:MAG: hypothetical protein ACOYOQ_14965 [Microthrixaceae bacterium]